MADFSAVPYVGVIPIAFATAESAIALDWPALAANLGMGGALVGFAIWLQDRMGRQHRQDTTYWQIELDTERKAHEATRRELIDHLKECHDGS